MNYLRSDANGEGMIPDRAGLGMEGDLPALTPYVVDVEIKVVGKILYSTPAL